MLQTQKNKSTLHTLTMNNTINTVKQWLQQKQKKYSDKIILQFFIQELLEELEQ